jgi:hypothetical protein
MALDYAQAIKEAADRLPDESPIVTANSMEGLDRIAAMQQGIKGK